MTSYRVHGTDDELSTQDRADGHRTDTATPIDLEAPSWRTTSTESTEPASSEDRGAPRLRKDGCAWGIGGLSLGLSTVFLLVGLAYNQGNVIPPLDDAYIHLQYAKQNGLGHFFQYNTGDPISAGASSLLYSLLMGAAYALGAKGSLFLPFAMGFGALCFAWTAVAIYLIGKRLMSRTVGTWAGVLVAANGALVWGATSGMEVGLVAALVASSVLAFLHELRSARFVLTPIVAALLAISRPEGLIFAVCLCAAMVWTILRGGRGRWRGRLGYAALALLPIAAGVGQLLFYRITTGTTSANGMQAKSLLHDPIVYPLEILDQTLTHFRDFVFVLGGLNNQDFVFPGALLLALLGTWYLLRDRRELRPLGIALIAGLLLVLLAISTLKNAHAHHLRYIQPFLPLILILAVVGVAAIASLFTTRSSRRFVLHGLLAVAVFFTAIELPAWGIRYGQQAAGIRDQPVSISNWMQGHLPPGSSVAVNDVGAAAYFTDHYIVDLIGLGTNGFAEPTVHGPGSLYEQLRTLPEERRPDYFSVFPNWSVHGLGEGGLFSEDPMMVFDIKSPEFSYQTPGAAFSCQAARFCNSVTLYEADWSLVGSGDLPAEGAPPGEIKDHINVASLPDEEAHGYEVVPAHRGYQPVTTVRTVPYPGEREVVDSGRHVIGGERMTARNLEPGKPVTITARVDTAEPSRDEITGSREVRVTANGTDLGAWQFAPDDKGWTETTFTIPGELVTGNSVTVELGPMQEFLGPYPDYTTFGYWFSQ